MLIYEMIASYTPFYHQNQLKMYDKIVRGKYRFPSHFSRGGKRIVAGLLEHKPTKRLGIIAGGTFFPPSDAMNDTNLWTIVCSVGFHFMGMRLRMFSVKYGILVYKNDIVESWNDSV